MNLSQTELDVLRASFARVAARSEATAALFYDTLFERAPDTRALFPGDMAVQGTKMMNTLGSIVARIHDVALLVPMVQDLAKRHVGYGVEPAHYDLLGEVLIDTLRRTLDRGFTDEAERAWKVAYAGLAATMVDAAWPASAAAAPAEPGTPAG